MANKAKMDRAKMKVVGQIKAAPQGCEVQCTTPAQLKFAQQVAKDLGRQDLTCVLAPIGVLHLA